jgi:hypothetical protein
MSMYRGLGGVTLSPVVMWPTGTDPFELSRDDMDTVFAHRDWLSAGVLMGNEYCSPLDPPFTDANADGYGQRFTIGTDHVGLIKRRRDGRANDIQRIADIVTQMPLSASPAHQFNADQSLLEAFAALPSRTDALAERIESALPLFTQANRLSERTTLAFDLVLFAAAFERLFDIHTPVAESLADAVSTLFSSFTQGSSTWQNLAVRSGRLIPDSGPWVKRWIREFYAHRSAIHGAAPPHSNDWPDLYHGLIATEVFTLSVKVLLDRDGTRSLSPEEVLATDALDDRVERLATTGTDVQAAWRDPYQAAQRRAMIAAAAQALSRQAGGQVPPVGGTI